MADTPTPDTLTALPTAELRAMRERQAARLRDLTAECASVNGTLRALNDEIIRRQEEGR